jgi:acetyl-CoA carboxylase biotin carboxyl carrier protein
MKKNNINTENLNIVQKFVDILNKNNLSELEYESDGIKIRIANKSFKESKVQEKIVEHSEDIKINAPTKKDDEPHQFTNQHPGAVNSPMVGTAYSSPEPGKDPFIKLNSSVSKGDTLLIIEAMKVMNTITAHKSGKVVFVGFENGQPIEFNQLLLIIE